MRIPHIVSVGAVSAALLLAALAATPLAAEEGFGFAAASDQAPAASGPARGASIGGRMDMSASAFLDDLDAVGDLAIGDLASARLEVSAAGSAADAFLALRLSRALFEDDPAAVIDEAHLRIYLGSTWFEAGLVKLAWGKADSQGPLDVVNPLDLSDLSVTDGMERKMARPMLRLNLGLGQSSRLEGVFVPSFEGLRVAATGAWAPARIATFDAMMDGLALGFGVPSLADVSYASLLSNPDLVAESASLASFQAGLRFTTSTGPVDWGLQYYYGFLPMPAIAITLAPVPSITMSYNRYHQAGADFAAVVAGFNLRAEIAANMTEDLEGDDPAVYNPALAFSLGFDRDLFAGINLNLQYAGSYRLFDDGVTSAYDVEYGTEAFSSTVTAVLMQGLFKDAIEWQLTALWELDDEDWLVMPSLSWNIGEASIGFAAGVFGGDEAGNLGQYSASNYMKLTATYRF